MKITSVRVRLFNGYNERIKAVASIVFDECFVVNSLRIIQGNERVFVSMPTEKDKKAVGYIDIAHPIKPYFREEIERVVLQKYEEELEKAAKEKETEADTEVKTETKE